jgi:hypothetical protein
MDDRFGRGLWRNASAFRISARVLVRWSWVALGGRLLVAGGSRFAVSLFGFWCVWGFLLYFGFWFSHSKLLALWILERNSTNYAASSSRSRSAAAEAIAAAAAAAAGR